MSTEVLDPASITLGRPDRYLVGIDGSGPSLAALHWALQRADYYGAEVLLAHVREPAASEGAGRLLLETATAIAAVAHPTVPLSRLLLSGDVADELARESADASLLVIGTHKTGYLHGRAMGSRSVFLASLARSSVAIIPDVSLVSRRGIVVGVDPADDSSVTVKVAALEADRAQQYLTVLTAESRAHSHPLSFPRVEGGGEILALAARRAIRFVPGLEVHSRASGRLASEALLDASRSATLLVLTAAVATNETISANGTVSATRTVGPITHDILMNINAPVLIVRDDSHEGDAPIPVLAAAGEKA